MSIKYMVECFDDETGDVCKKETFNFLDNLVEYIRGLGAYINTIKISTLIEDSEIMFISECQHQIKTEAIVKSSKLLHRTEKNQWA